MSIREVSVCEGSSAMAASSPALRCSWSPPGENPEGEAEEAGAPVAGQPEPGTDQE
nr:hypothetical protein [Streptomyces albidoflavus]